MSKTSIRKVLYIGFVWPEPGSSAAGSRSLELIHLFRAQAWEVQFASAAALSEHRADLGALQVVEREIRLNCDSFDRYLQEYQPDLVLFDRFFTEEQFGWRVEKMCPSALRVLDTQDLHSLRDARHQLLKQAQSTCRNEAERYAINPPYADSAALQQAMLGQDLAQREIAAIYRSDLTLMISDAEMQLLQQEFAVPSYLLHHCNLMLIPTVTATIPFSQRQHFICIGNFRHAPNWDSVLWLKHSIWPAIRRQLPAAQLHVYGAYPPPKAVALHNPAQGFHLMGWVDDAQSVMAQARICLAPLRFGAGIKGKLADAMACDTPSITTSIGQEGMALGLPWAGVVGDDAETLAQAAVNLYQDPQQWQYAQDCGRRILTAHFDRAAAQTALIAALSKHAEQREALRQRNFIGAMLRHHLHKSTQYMSQWIAAKTNHASNQVP